MGTGGDDHPDDGASEPTDDVVVVPPRRLDPDEELTADAAMMVNAKKRLGAVGGALAAGMFGLDQAMGRKPREEAPVVIDANSDPYDVDTDGIDIAVDDTLRVVSPPLPRTEPPAAAPRPRRRWR